MSRFSAGRSCCSASAAIAARASSSRRPRPGSSPPTRAAPADRRRAGCGSAARPRASRRPVRSACDPGRGVPRRRRGRGSPASTSARRGWSASPWPRRRSRSPGSAGRASRRARGRSRRGPPTARGPRRASGVRGPGAGPTYGATPRARTAGTNERRLSNSWRAQSALPASTSWSASTLPELDQHLDVERGVLEPRLGQRPGRPVDGGVLLLHPRAEQRLDQGRQPDPRVVEQPAGELGVEQRRRRRPTSARQGRSWVAACRIHSASPIASCSGRERRQGDRVDQRGAGALAAQLDQVGAVGVAVAGGPLGVDRDRSGAGGEQRRRTRPAPRRCR